MSEIFTEQLTAVSNVVLAAFAIVTALLAGLACRAQFRQLKGRSAQAVQVHVAGARAGPPDWGTPAGPAGPVCSQYA